MRKRNSTDDFDKRNPLAASRREEIRRTSNYVVRFHRNEFFEPGLPPFWELTVEDSGYSYRAIICVPADELEEAMQNLPEPNAERHGVDFMRAYKEVFLPDEIRRLTGERVMGFFVYKVKFAPPLSPFKEGRYYNDADPDRPITQTEADVAANEKRKRALFTRLKAEQDCRSAFRI